MTKWADWCNNGNITLMPMGWSRAKPFTITTTKTATAPSLPCQIFPVNNSDYRRWRENSKNKDPNGIGFGRDMILFSKIKIQDIEGLSIIVRIEDERNIKK